MVDSGPAATDVDATWVPITSLLAQAREALPIGGLVHGEAFSMFEAMSAVEIGNPKMDAACMASTKSLEALIVEGAAAVDLSHKQLLGVMDQLFALQATWHNGGSLAQTVYTCLYLLQPDRVQDNLPLAAFCKVLRSLCMLVRALIMQGAVSEEEDFNPHTFGLPLDEYRSQADDKCLAAVSLAVDRLTETKAKLIREAGAKASSSAQDEPATTDAIHLHDAVIARLLFLRELHMGLNSVLKKSAAEVEPARKHLTKATDLLVTIQQTTQLGCAVESAFDEGINRQLLAPAPPRVVKVLTMEDALAHFKQLLQHLQQALAVSKIKDYHALQLWVDNFARLRAGPVARSAAHYLVKNWSGNGVADDPANLPPWVVSREMLANVCDLPSTSSLNADVDTFLEQAVIAVSNWCQVMLMNSCRQRRRLRRGLEDWSNLYQHALNADVSPDYQAFLQQAGWRWAPLDGLGQDIQGPLGTWVERETCHNMLLHLLLGFELELYEPREFVMVYWYCSALYVAYRNATTVLQNTMRRPASATSKAAGKPRKGGQQQQQEDARLSQLHQHFLSDMLQSEVLHYMCQGYIRMMLGLEKAGIVKSPELPFNTLAQRFDQRFAVFHHMIMRPEPLTYDTFVGATGVSDFTAAQLMKLAAESFATVRQTYKIMLTSPQLGMMSPEKVSLLKPIDQVAARNMLASNVVMQALQNSTDVSLTYDFGFHPYFPAVGVKTAAAAQKAKQAAS